MRWPVLAAVALIAAAFGALGTSIWQRYGVAVPAPERARIERIVHAYLVAHPEVLVEASTALRRREAGKAIAASGSAFTKPYASAWAGNPDGDVTLVEYFDYNCGYCRASLPVIDELLAGDPKLKIVYREWPILSDESAIAARYSLAAAEQGRFREFHRALYAGGPISEASIAKAARGAGLDPARLKAEAAAPRIEAELQRNLDAARELRLTGTPSWVIGDQTVSSALSLDALKRLVAEARAGR